MGLSVGAGPEGPEVLEAQKRLDDGAMTVARATVFVAPDRHLGWHVATHLYAAIAQEEVC